MGKSIFVLITAIFLFMQINIRAQKGQSPEAWKEVTQILKNIVPPTFPDKVFNIEKYGAVGDGKTDCSEAFNKAIETCSKSGGGIVLVPQGTFLTGPIHLKSNVNLRVVKGATIKFSRDTKKYLPLVLTRFEGVECMNYSPFVYAYEQKNIAVTGEGVLDGQASCEYWWPWKGRTECGWVKGMPDQKAARKKLFEMGEKGVPVKDRNFGEGFYLRPNFVQPYRCKNVLIEGITLKNSPMWVMNPVLCENVSIINVKVNGLGPNTDGCDPSSCKNVLIKGCRFNTGDDCIAIKSGRNNDGRRINVPSQNIIIQDCSMKDGHGGVTVGSEISGGCYNVFAEDCIMDSPNLNMAFRIKTNSVRGGHIENIYMRNVKVGQVAQAAVRINLYYEEGDTGNHTPLVKNIGITNLTCNKSEYAIFMKGYKRAPIENVDIADCKFNNVEKESIIESVKNIKLKDVTVNGKAISNK